MTDIDPNNGPDNTADNKGNADPDNGPEAFKAITSQEDFDKAIQSRLTRERNKADKKYEGYDDFKAKAEAFDKLEAEQGSELEKANRRAEKAEKDLAAALGKIASADRRELVRDLADELKLPKAFVKRVQGDTEDEIRADIEDLLKGLPSTQKEDSKQDDKKDDAPPSRQPKQKMTFTQTGDESDEGLNMSADDILKDVPRGGGVR